MKLGPHKSTMRHIEFPGLLLLIIRILCHLPLHIQKIMTHTYGCQIFTIRTLAWWCLLRSEEEAVRGRIRWAVRAFGREI